MAACWSWSSRLASIPRNLLCICSAARCTCAPHTAREHVRTYGPCVHPHLCQTLCQMYPVSNPPCMHACIVHAKRANVCMCACVHVHVAACAPSLLLARSDGVVWAYACMCTRMALALASAYLEARLSASTNRRRAVFRLPRLSRSSECNREAACQVSRRSRYMHTPTCTYAYTACQVSR